MSLPLSLQLYRAAVWVATPLSGWILGNRARRGKEDATRLNERFGRTELPRPAGRLLWLHGASVGESLVLLELVRRLQDKTDWQFLVTTGTVTSARLMAEKLPAGARHQYIPVDRLGPVRRFLDHWQPDAAIFVESELWPNLLIEMQSRNIPAALVNARMNEASLINWHKRKDGARHLLSTFRWIGAADERTAAGLQKLAGHAVPLVGNLKLQISASSPDRNVLDAVRAVLGERPVWLAASTHAGEEQILLQAHRQYLETRPDALLILAPRHPERGGDLANTVRAAGLTLAQRSRNELPDTGTQVWLADTLGEMTLWYALADQAVIGGSLKDGIGGHNPVEATRAGCPVISGPYTASFDDVFAAYRKHEGVAIAESPAEIAAALSDVTEDRLAGAQRALRELTGSAMDETLAAILSLMPEEPQ